ncbi:hypothetical protein C8R43DRAFT_1241164 [Mycena crocata]|nr:hypothetical protein C8R43DRAFT_1241164 [Mycena crocata]
MGEPCLLPVLDALPLRRLSACLRRFFHNSGPKIDFSYPLFSQITHLDILDWDDHWPFYSDIAKMPALTHVSLSYHQSIPRDICRGVLGHCKKLKVLVIVPSSRRILKSFSREPRIADLLTDPRFVLVLVTDDLENWEISARGGDDYWAIADTIVEKQRWEDVSPAE